MARRFKPNIEILPAAQKEIWPVLAPAAKLSYVLYGGTAVALGHHEFTPDVRLTLIGRPGHQ